MRQNGKNSSTKWTKVKINMRIWYDACTGKHIRYGAAVAKHFRKAGHEVVFTTREHPDTFALARILGEDPIVVGKYEPATLFSRLEQSSKRIIHFSKMFRENPPDVAICHQSVELCRTAFGMGIPIVSTADTPHAKAVNKLTLTFADTLVVSEALPSRFLKRYCSANIVRFKGVDEVAWIKDIKPSKRSQFEKPLIVVREVESKAAYALETNNHTLEMARNLETLGKVVILKRYSGREEFVDSVRLVADADLVVSAGGTIAREAALQGVPSIVTSEFGRTYVNTYLMRKGFPIFMCSPRKVMKIAKQHVGNIIDVAAKLAEFDNPVEIIEKAVMQLNLKSKE